MIKRNNLVYNVDSVNEYVGDKNINQPILVVVKDVTLINDYKLKIFYNNGVTKNIELVNNSIKNFEYVSEGNKIIIETNNNDKFEIEIPIYWGLVEGLLRTKDGTKITLQDINEIDTELGAEDIFLNKKGEFITIQTSPIGVSGSELYMSVQDSDVAGYKLLSNAIDTLETEITITASSADGIVWGNKYLTPEYTATTIPAKSWGFDYWRKVSSTLNNSFKHLRVFIYRGGVETDIIALTSPDINDTDFTERQIAYTLSAIELQQGDRIGVQDGFSTGRGEDVTLTYIIGDGRGWFMRVPLAMSHKGLTDKNAEGDFQHVTQAEKDLITSTAAIANVNTGDILDLQTNKADKATTLSGYGITDAYTQTEIDNKISVVFRYKGSVPTYVDLTALTGMTIGDVYNVTETGGNYAWTSTEWDKLSGEIDLSAYLTIVDASNTYETIANVNSLSIIVSGNTGDISDLQTNKADKATTISGYGITDAYTKTEIDTNFENHKTYSDVTREELLNIINNNELIPNSSYRITNYTTTTGQTDTTSAGHDFDVIVTALSTNELSEIASCVRKSDDTYFENADLEAWEIKYCIHNDTSRFAWADVVNGKGVIYYMKDEWNNECPYDFKNIQFKKSSVFLYTFGGTADDSLSGGCHRNIIMDYISSSVLTLNFNTFGDNSYSNTFGYNCYSNTFGSYCMYNTFGNSCNYNTFGNSCYSIMFGIGCYSNTFGNDCNSNTFADSCKSNTFGNDCRSNKFDNSCTSNTFDNNCYSNTFGNSCNYNTFYAGNAVDAGTTKKDYIRYIVLEDGCANNNFYSTLTTSSTSYLQRIRIKGLEFTTATNTQINLSAVNTKYEWLICYTSGGMLKQYCPDNNDTYKIENTSVSTWTASTAYAGYDYQARINIPNLTENDNASVIFDGAEVISGNYYPTIQIYEGYILIFSKVNATITIPTIEITKIDL